MPSKTPLIAGLVAAVVLFACAATWWVTDARWSAKWDQHIAADTSATLAQYVKVQLQQQTIAKKLEAENDRAESKKAALVAAVAVNSGYAERLRDAANADPVPANCGAPTTEQRAAAATDRIVRSDVLGRLSTAAAGLARYADETSAALDVCLNSYEIIRAGLAK